MRDIAILVIHLFATIAKLVGRGGARSIVAESLLLKHQLLILNRSRERAPNLRPSDQMIAGLCGGWPAVCRLFGRAIANSPALPHRLSSDRDPLFEYRQWKANLRILEISEVKTVPYVPLSHPFIERLVGTIRRELLDQVPFWNARDLERKLVRFRDYYNRERVHASLDGITPDSKIGAPSSGPLSLARFRWKSHCRGLYQLPAAA